MALRLENYRRMGFLSEYDTKLTFPFNNFGYKHHSPMTLVYIEKYLQQHLDGNKTGEIFAILDKADEKNMLLEQWDEPWEWSEYLTYLSEILEPNPNDPKIQIYRELGILRQDGNVYLPGVEKEIKLGMGDVSSTKIERLISANLTKELVDEIAYIVKRSLNGEVFHFFENVMFHFTGFKSLIEARYAAYEKLGIVADFGIRKPSSTKSENVYTMSFCPGNRFMIDYRMDEITELTFTSSAKIPKELFKSARSAIINFLDKNSSRAFAKLIDMILDKTIDDIAVTTSAESYEMAVAEVTYNILGKDFKFTHTTSPVFTQLLLDNIRENLIKMKRKTDLAKIVDDKLNIYESLGVLTFNNFWMIRGDERILRYFKPKFPELAHHPAKTVFAELIYPRDINSSSQAERKNKALILKDLEATMPDEIKTLIKMVENGVISNVESVKKFYNHQTTLKMIISSTGQPYKITHEFKLDELRNIIHHIRKLTAEAALMPACSSTSFMLDLNPIDKPLPYPNIFFNQNTEQFEGVCEIPHLDTRIFVPNNDGDIWKLSGQKIPVKILIDSRKYGKDGWSVVGMEFQKIYDPSKFYVFITSDIDGPALTLYKYVLLHMAKYVNE